MNKSTKKDHTPLTKEQGKVLIKACDYIIKNKEVCQKRLRMNHFSFNEGREISPSSKKINECGTTCCFLGHFPMAGIKAKRNEDWWLYLRRVMSDDYFSQSDAYKWLFDSGWPNDIDFCLKRAAYALRFGVPPFNRGAWGFAVNYEEQAKKIRPNWNKLKEIYGYQY